MTETIETPTGVDTELKPINHWIGGRPYEGQSGRTGPVYNPALGIQTGAVDLASAEEVDWRSRPRRRRSPRGARSRSRAGPISSSASASSSTTTARTSRGCSRSSTARCLRRDRRGRARARGDRVLLRHPDAAQGRVLGAGLDRDRRLLDPPAARRRRRDHAVQLPRDGPDVDVGARARVRQHVRAQAVGKGPVCVGPTAELLAEAGVPEGVFNVVHGDKVAVDALLEHPDVAAISFVGSTPIAKYVYETATRTASAARRSAGRRTT